MEDDGHQVGDILREETLEEAVPDGERDILDGREPCAERKECPVLAYSEFNFLRLPWAVIDPRQAGTTRRLLVTLGRERYGLRSWMVTAGDEGMPDPFDRGVFRACEWMAVERTTHCGGPFPDHFVFNAREICERLCVRESASTVPSIRRALKRLRGVRIVDMKCFSHCGENGSGSGQRAFRLLGDPPPLQDKTPKRRALRAPLGVAFDRAFGRSVGGGQLVPLDWEMWVSLHPSAQRLLEILSVSFADPDLPEAAFGMADLCALFPLKTQGSPASARRILLAAQEELGGRNFLKEALWEGDRRVTFRPGSAVRALRNRLRPGRPYSALARELAAAMVETSEVDEYQKLVDFFDRDQIMSALAHVRFLKERGMRMDKPRATLVDILRRGIRSDRRDWSA